MPRTRLLAAALATLSLLGVAPAVASSGSSPADLAGSPLAPLADLPGLDRLNALAGEDGLATGIVSLDAVPTDAVADALRRLGLEVQPMRHLPLALVRGPVAALRAVVRTGLGVDVYPSEPIQLLDTASSDAMGAAMPRAAGFTGKGTTVAVVDSGCDATHPDLADHVTHNVKLVSGEYANVRPEAWNTIVVPIDQGPYANSDLGSGHGTHVAGIIAADGTTGPEHLGVAPDADLVCLSIGEVLFTTAVVTAYDHLLDQPDLWGVDVINNSWGNLYGQFDPRNPVAVATKAVADQGVTVVFAAGNAGDGNGEGTLNPFSQSPWVLSVAAESVDHVRGSFSSNGLRFDNSVDVPIGPGGRTTFTGDQVGLVHPDVTAPGVDISSTCDVLGATVGPCPPGENTTASGTSMASPHVAGAVAVLLQANPRLSPTQVRRLLQTTAQPVRAVDATGEPTSNSAPFWQVGFGRVDLTAAVRAARSGPAIQQLEARQRERNQAVLAASGVQVLRNDFATWDAPVLSLGTDVRSFTVAREPLATRMKVTVVFPSEATLGADLGLTQYSVVVRDAAGRILVAGTQPVGIGAAGALVDLPRSAVGPYTVTVTGDRSLSDPDTIDSDSVLNDTVTVQVAQLRPR
jgi:serine protease AprX